MVRSEYFSSVDMDIHYQTEGDGPVLICLHGGKGNSGDYFFPYLSPLAENLKMVYLDERGSGKSKPVPNIELISIEGFLRDIDNLVEHLGVRQVGLLGHSFGARLALLYAVEHPEKVRELYVVAGGLPYPEIEEWLFEFRENAMKSDGGFQVRKEIQDLYNSGEISSDESFRRQVVEGTKILYKDAPEAKLEAILEAMNRTDCTCFDDKNSNFGSEPERNKRLLQELDTIACPTLIMPGQNDLSFSVECCGLMARSIPGCEMSVIRNSGHFPFIDEPDLFLKAVKEFRSRKVLK